MAKYTIGDIFEGDFPVTQYYGERPAYYAQFGLLGHEGVDWGTPNGTKVLAPFKRNIILRDVDLPGDRDYGDFIVVFDPDQNCAVWYCHLQENYVQVGQEFPYGTVLGLSNNTGNSSGPHLHVNFVETDANRNRLNTGNGNQGFLNILDPNLVQWNLGGQSGTITPPPPITMDAQKEQVIIDARKALTGEYPTDAEKQADLTSGKNTYDLIKGYTGDHRFYELYVQPAVQAKDDRIMELDTQVSKAQQAQLDAESANKQQAILIDDLRKQLEVAQKQPGTTPPPADPTPQPPLSKEDVSYLQSFVTWLKKVFPQKKKS